MLLSLMADSAWSSVVTCREAQTRMVCIEAGCVTDSILTLYCVAMPGAFRPSQSPSSHCSLILGSVSRIQNAGLSAGKLSCAVHFLQRGGSHWQGSICMSVCTERTAQRSHSGLRVSDGSAGRRFNSLSILLSVPTMIAYAESMQTRHRPCLSHAIIVKI